MHADSLNSTDQVHYYLGQLISNTERAVQAAVAEGSPDKLLAVVGITLHTVQDVFAHSSWTALVRRSNCSTFSSTTYFGAWHEAAQTGSEFLGGVVGDALVTGCFAPGGTGTHCVNASYLHGDLCSGLNQDNSERPRFEEAYVSSVLMSIEWVEALRRWTVNATADSAGSSVWEAARTYHPPTVQDERALNSDLALGRRLIEALQIGATLDGHYKGTGSGDLRTFLRSSLAFARQNLPTSPYLALFGRDTLPLLTTPSLYAPDRATAANYNRTALLRVPPVSKVMPGLSTAGGGHIVSIRSVHAERNFASLRVEVLSNLVRVGDVPYASALLKHNEHREYLTWTVLHPVAGGGSPVVGVQYQLFDRDKTLDINPVSPAPLQRLASDYEFTVDLETGAVAGADGQRGVFDSPHKTLNLTGRSQPTHTGSLTFFVNTMALANPAPVDGNGLDDPFTACPSTVFGLVGEPPLCTDIGGDLAMNDFLDDLGILLVVYIGGVVVLVSLSYCCVWWWTRTRRQRGRFSSASLRHATSIRLEPAVPDLVPYVASLPGFGSLYSNVDGRKWFGVREADLVEMEPVVRGRAREQGGGDGGDGEAGGGMLNHHSGTSVVTNGGGLDTALGGDQRRRGAETAYNNLGVQIESPGVILATPKLYFVPPPPGRMGTSGEASVRAGFDRDEDGLLGASPAAMAANGTDGTGGGHSDETQFAVVWMDETLVPRLVSVIRLLTRRLPERRTVRNFGEWSRPLQVAFFVCCLEMLILFSMAIIVVLTVAGRYQTCADQAGRSGGGEDPWCASDAMTVLPFGAAVGIFGWVYGIVMGVGVVGPVFAILALLFCAKPRALRRAVYAFHVINTLEVMPAAILYWASVVLIAIPGGYCHALTSTCYPCTGLSLKACTQTAAGSAFDPGCYYDTGVRDAICTTLYGRILAAAVFGIAAWVVKVSGPRLCELRWGCFRRHRKKQGGGARRCVCDVGY